MVSRRTVLKLGGLSVVASPLVRPGTAAAAGPAGTAAITSEIAYLSGTGKDDPVDWRFMVSSGHNSGTWSTIPVPSNWELQGFGSFEYGQLVKDHPEEVAARGVYEHAFTVPAAWRGRRIFLVFEGSMTDTTVAINDVPVGPTHQGGFVQFRYDVTERLVFGRPNLLQVTVDNESANASINGAERRGDFWIFGGIYRPVYLLAQPAEYVKRVAIDAPADGRFSVEVFTGATARAGGVRVQLRTTEGKPVGPAVTAALGSGGSTTLTTTVQDPALWTAETPNLYEAEVTLTAGSTDLHQIIERFGFRTIEVRPGQGLFVNGTRVMLKGINRHAEWPESGRTTSAKLDRDDILLMKAMNINAVRLSHYPQDQDFYDCADELGLYLLDELTGWGSPYDTPSAKRLVKELVVRDVNHPSVIFWDNGNEGAWNTAVDGDFALYDPQRRTVLHPSSTPFNGVRTTHYPSYQNAVDYLTGEPDSNYLPTEFLHAIYDGGGGAALADYWDLMTSRPNSGGGFIWALLDAGIVRADQGGRINVAGDRGPDGVVGPFREREGSFAAIREIWSPIRATLSPAGTGGFGIELRNEYDFTDLADCGFAWSLIGFHRPDEDQDGHTVVAAGTVKATAGPGRSTTSVLRPPAPAVARADALTLTATDPSGREVASWVWPLTDAAGHRDRIVKTGPGTATACESAGTITMTAAGTEITVSKDTGQLVGVRKDGRTLSLANGPVAAVGTATLTGITHHRDGSAYVVRADYTGGLSSVTWRLRGDGWLALEYAYGVSGDRAYSGVSFDYPEDQVGSLKWLGKGPYRVWKNRLQGPTTGVWSKTYNDTVTGADGWQYPEFKGYHAGTYWAVLGSREGDITMVTEQDDLFLRLFTPSFGPNPGRATAVFPGGNISFLDEIAPVGNKNHVPADTGPSGRPNSGDRQYRRTIWFSFAPKATRLAIDALDEIQLGQPVAIVTRFTNDAAAVDDVTLTLAVPRGWTAQPRTPDHFGVVGTGQTVRTTWTVTPPPKTYGRFTVKAEAGYLDPATRTRRAVWSEATDAVVASGPKPPELMAWYKFDGDTNDSSGYRSLPATVSGSVSWVGGRVGQAAQLDGNSHLRLPEGVLANAREATVACWVKLDAAPRWLRIFDFGFDRTTYLFVAQGDNLRPPELTDSMLMFAITMNGSGAEQRLHAPALPTGVWKHVAVTLSGKAGGRLYIDGVQVDANPAMDLVPMYLGDTTRNYVGRSQFQGDPYLPGAVDDLRIYGRALTPGEVGDML
ncbi:MULTISPECIES: glycoside hydrolase family 2 TIM barrel-domain containing protein [Kribbella]|uniref:beta-galactosidase n=1 Tax=Kribbella karoonensis TaxID=324851 RepID=A0ABN2DRI2_9ACTN